MGERCGGYFRFGTTQQRVIELAGTFHRRKRDGTVMRADKVQRAEVEACDTGQFGDRPRVMDGARSFDQHAQRNCSAEPFACTVLGQRFERAFDVADGLGFRQCQKRNAIAGFADQNLQIVFPRGMADVVDARADAVVRVGGRADQLGDHPRMLGLKPKSPATSNTGPRARCSSSALAMNRSLPA